MKRTDLELFQPAEFWGRVARSELTWMKDFDTVMDCDMNAGSFKWFEGGVINASVNCVDRHAQADPNRVALLWEQDEPGQEVPVTYAELSSMVNRMANVLKR